MANAKDSGVPRIASNSLELSSFAVAGGPLGVACAASVAEGPTRFVVFVAVAVGTVSACTPGTVGAGEVLAVAVDSAVLVATTVMPEGEGVASDAANASDASWAVVSPGGGTAGPT